MAVLGKASQLISAERKVKLKPALNVDIRSLHDSDHIRSDYLFGENILESLKLTKENYKLAQNLAKSKSTPRHKSSGSSDGPGYKRRYDAEAPSSTRASLGYQGRNKLSAH